MSNVVILINDDRLRKQTEHYLEQLEMDTLRVVSHKSHQEFASTYFREAQSSEDVVGDIHLLIFALDSIGEKSNPWIEKIKINLKKFKHWPQNAPVRMIVLKYEDDGISKLDVLHPQLDDLIYLPMDRLVFLQKVEILLALPQRAKPKHLFSQEVKQDIEISKITKMDRLSDVGLAIRNPLPLRKGLPGHFYVQLPGEKTRLEVRGKVFRSEPHPEFPGQYLVYFSYFGLTKADLTAIRRALAKASRYQSLYNDDRARFRFNPGDLFHGETSDEKVHGIAVIDTDNALANNLALQISKDLDRVKVVTESSYSLFLHKYFSNNGMSDRERPLYTEPNDFYRLPLSFTVSATDFKCMNVTPQPGENDKLFGHKATDLFATPEKWLSLIADKASRLVLEEAIMFAGRGRISEKLIIVQDEKNERRAVNIKIERGGAAHLVNIEFSPGSLDDIAKQSESEERNKELHALILDVAFVPEDTSTWIEGLRARALQIGLIQDPNALKFFLIADAETRSSQRWLNISDILGLFIKPVDTRQLGFMLSEHLPNKYTVYQFENLGWAHPSLPVHVSKNAQLEALSEFGVRLKSKMALAPGTMIYLRKSIYDNAPNNCLASRVYACEEHPIDKGYFSVYATYFGINDQFLKFARTWIRENYASQKGRD